MAVQKKKKEEIYFSQCDVEVSPSRIRRHKEYFNFFDERRTKISFSIRHTRVSQNVMPFVPKYSVWHRRRREEEVAFVSIF